MFQRATRKKAKLRLAIAGPSGSGKTYGALMVAQGLGGRIAMIDTEHGSGELYSDLCEYDVARLDPPYTPARYIKAMRAAQDAGYDVLIIDSLSHAWAGEGGVLEMVDKTAKASRSGNSFNAWREVTPEQNRLVDSVLKAGMHIVITMRTKTAYEVVEDDRGKKAPKKIGLAPVQRDGLEYEMTVVMDLSVESHIATASKDRTRLFDGKHIELTPDVGVQLREWLDSGATPEVIAEAPDDDRISDAQISKLLDMVDATETDLARFLSYAKVAVVEDIKTSQIDQLMTLLEGKQQKQQEAGK